MREKKMWFKQNKENCNDCDVTVKSEYEKVTNQLIQETVGDRGILRKEFERKINEYNAENNPLGVAEAENIIMSLLEVAMAQRKLLSQRIERSIDGGNLYEQYFGRMEEINNLDSVTQVKMKEMQTAKKHYEKQVKIYEKVIGKTYESTMQPDDKDIKEDVNIDPWEEMDKEGGIKYDEHNE